jgi:hypothetical protein
MLYPSNYGWSNVVKVAQALAAVVAAGVIVTAAALIAELI